MIILKLILKEYGLKIQIAFNGLWTGAYGRGQEPVKSSL